MYRVAEFDNKTVAVVPHNWVTDDGHVLWKKNMANYYEHVENCDPAPTGAKKCKVIIHRSTGKQ